MLKILIKKQLLELFQGYFVDKKTGKARTKKGTLIFFALLAFLFVSLGFAFYSMAGWLGGAILGNGFNWLYFALMGLLAMALGVFGSVFNTYASVYLPKDNELLMSLPIPAGTLLLARLAGVYITGLMYSAWVWIPVTIAYWVTVPVTVLNVLFPILMTFVIALFVSVLSCILGWVVALIASKTKGKSIVTVILSLTVLVLYYVVYFRVVNSLSKIVAHITEIGNAVRSWLHYSYRLGLACDGDVLSMLIVAGITLALAGICFLVLSKTLFKLSTVSAGDGKKSKVTAKYTQRTVRAALLRREYRQFTSTATWMLNDGIGLLLMPVAAVALLIKSGSIRAMLPKIAAAVPSLSAGLPALFVAVVCLLLSAAPILPVSVSIEGKTLWQIRSLPVDPWEVLRAKERMSIQLSVCPAVFFVLVCGVILRFHWWETALVAVAAVAYVLLFSDFGLFLNLKMPNFTWTNTAYLTKQSMAVTVALFGGWGFCVVLGLAAFLLTKVVPVWVTLCAFCLLFLVLRIVLHTWLKKRGTAIFAAL